LGERKDAKAHQHRDKQANDQLVFYTELNDF
jgi:hypothetical protein